jgi:hypothetical protein
VLIEKGKVITMKMMETGTGRLPFEQQPREGNKPYEAFRLYLEMGTDRSLDAVRVKCGKSARLIQRWSGKFDWPGRVQAYHAHVAEVERKAIESMAVEKAVEWAKTHDALKRQLWRKGEEAIAMFDQARAEWLAKGRLPGWEGMARMLELAFKLKQFAAGMPSEVKQVETHVTGTIDVEWEIAIRKAYGDKAESGKQKAETVVVDVETVDKAESEKAEIGKLEGGKA